MSEAGCRPLAIPTSTCREGSPILPDAFGWPPPGPAPAPFRPKSRLTPYSFPRSSRCLRLSHQMRAVTWITRTCVTSSRMERRRTSRPGNPPTHSEVANSLGV